MTDRLSELEQRAAVLNAEIAALKAGKAAPPPPPPRDEGVRVTELLTELTDGMPNLKEMERLFAKVRPLSPWPQALNDRFDEHRPFRGFSSCFRWVMNMGRLDRPNGKVALSYWIDSCKNWLRARNSVASDLDVNALILACFAAGDICFVPANSALGHVWEIGLIEHGGRKASDAWRGVMTTGQILPPSAPARRTPPFSPVRIYGG